MLCLISATNAEAKPQRVNLAQIVMGKEKRRLLKGLHEG